MLVKWELGFTHSSALVRVNKERQCGSPRIRPARSANPGATVLGRYSTSFSCTLPYVVPLTSTTRTTTPIANHHHHHNSLHSAQTVALATRIRPSASGPTNDASHPDPFHPGRSRDRIVQLRHTTPSEQTDSSGTPRRPAAARGARTGRGAAK